MKNYIIIAVFILFVLGCRDSKYQYQTSLMLLLDHTDSVPVYPTGKEISALLDYSQNPWKGSQVGITTITDKDINTWELINIKAEDEILGNKNKRLLKIDHFEHTIDTTLETFKNLPNKVCNHSIIYRPIVSALNTLTKTTAERKICIISSNFYENNNTLNFYSPQTLQVLQNKPTAIINKLEEDGRLLDLSEIEIWMLYEPLNFKDNNHFMIVANFYKNLFERHHATVHLVSHL